MKLDALAGHCRTVGRDPRSIRKSLVVQAVVRESASEVDEGLERLARTRNATVASLRERGMYGTPEQCVEQLVPYVQAGVGDFILGARMPADMRTLELVATKVAPMLRERMALANGAA